MLEAVLLFHVNLLIASLLLTLVWWYIIHHFDELNPGGQNPCGRGREKALVIPAVTLLAIWVSFINTRGEHVVLPAHPRHPVHPETSSGTGEYSVKLHLPATLHSQAYFLLKRKA